MGTRSIPAHRERFLCRMPRPGIRSTPIFTAAPSGCWQTGRNWTVRKLSSASAPPFFGRTASTSTGKKVFLRGLNRHQSYPYIGYAAPESLQREDARIHQEELGCNAVRTSHYPQSQYFLDECDRRGLLVFTEIPGWQHIGDQPWKDQACENVREMILQNRNHPAIVLWGVRINESVDDDPFYIRTNAIAHELDPSLGISPRTDVPIAGYSSWYNRYQDIRESTIVSDLNGCQTLLTPGDLFQVDDGWEPFVGDWM